MKKIPDGEADKKIRALLSLREHWGWPVFMEMVQYIQGMKSSELFSKSFLKLDAVEKDKRHAAIVETLNTLNKLFEFPEMLEKRKASRWEDFRAQMIEEIKK